MDLLNISEKGKHDRRGTGAEMLTGRRVGACIVAAALLLSFAGRAYASEPDLEMIGKVRIRNGGTGADSLSAARTSIIGPNRVFNIVDDYGADNTGATDTTAAIQTAIDAKLSLYFPCGTYKVSTTITSAANNVNYYGAGQCTIISTASGTNDVFVVSGFNAHVHDMQFIATTTRTAGSYVKLTGYDQRLYHFTMTFPFIGVYMGGSDTNVDSGYIASTRPGGKSIYVNTAGGAQVIGSGMVMLGEVGLEPLAGIHVVNTQDLTIGAANIIRQGTGLLVAPDTGQVVASLNLLGTFLDTNAVRGVDLCRTGSGAIVRGKASGVWASSNGSNGIRTCAGVQGMDFAGSHVLINGADGISILGGTNVNFIGGECAQNTGYCVNVGSGISNWSVTGMQIGAVGGLTTNTVGGISTSGVSDFYSIVNNNFNGQTGNVVYDNANGTHKNVHSNPNDPADYSFFRETATGYLMFGGTQGTYSGYKFLTDDGTLRGTLNSTGLALTSSTASSSTITGALTTPGGAGFGGNLNVGGAINQFGAAAGAPAHIATGQNTAPALTSCGTSPTIVGTDTAGKVTMGTTATGCVITFNVAYAAEPHCTVTWRATPLASQSYVVAAGSITLTQTSADNNIVNYVCVGRSGG